MNTLKWIVSALLLAGLFTVLACEKADLENAPSRSKSASNAELIDGYGDDARWNEFVERVERGDIKDPLGQFLQKDTTKSVAEGEEPSQVERDTIPKYSAEERNKLLTDLVARGQLSPDEVVYASRNYGYHFASSEGQGYPLISAFNVKERRAQQTHNPQNFVYDLKIVKGGRNPLPHYTLINADLNRGAGGQNIYLSFTRNVYRTRYAPQEGSNPQQGPVRDITAVTQRVGAIFTSWPANFVPTFTPWNCTWNGTTTWCYKEGDLNDGAGGRFIYAYQTKLASTGLSPIEVGVVSGNRNVQPPSGWARVGPDLNAGAGGAYVYFCVGR